MIGYDKTFTLSTMQQDTVCYSVENHPNDSRVKIRDDGTVQTLSARCGTGGAIPHAHLFYATQFAGYKETLPTLRASGGDYGGGSEGLIVMIIDSHPADSRFTVFGGGVTPTITRHIVKGGSEGPIVMYEVQAIGHDIRSTQFARGGAQTRCATPTTRSLR